MENKPGMVSEKVEKSDTQSTDVKPSFWGSVAASGQAIAKTAVGGVAAIGNTAYKTGKAVVKTAAGVGETAAKQTQKLISQTTQGAGRAVNYVGDNQFLRHVTRALPTTWLLGIINQVDVVKAENAVRDLQQKHPKESPNQVAHRLMVEKAVYGGGMGLATSFLPGQALALLTVDLAATTLLQAEMVYQIAAAYGLDLKDPARKGEVLAIFGLSLGGSQGIKAGLGLLKATPVAGAVIGASANATMIYALGYAACRFYEAQLHSQVSEDKLVETQAASESYLQTAIAQQAIMDRILVHTIVASYPGKSWEDILPSLQAANLSPASIDAIASNIKSPQPLDTLLDQLNRDYAIPLLAQCYRVSELDSALTPEESKVIDKITQRFDIDVDAIKKLVNI
ncbi:MULTISPECIES: EcsC family protein [Cyanophyceae]|uniref:EcsC family protein n=1 Tax=Cyanophyceae TaxID=3028117 RepID=UPI0016835FDF|nr:EcsC family protein [Trichocoleus sp. FACHB-69]MBD1931638.1 hypothetical protein [Trichocoleus sp. FACHB-69]